MLRRTPLHDQHCAAGGKMVDFAGWEMPLHYGSQLEEHRVVRSRAGVFDVSHMTVVDISGSEALAFLRHLLANDVAQLTARGQAIYSCMLNDGGGILDDLIVYYLSEGRYRLVVNAATREKDLQWMQGLAGTMDLRVRERADMAMLAVQGPEAPAQVAEQVEATTARKLAELKPFQGLETGDWLIARTGYTGEDGFEIILPQRQVVSLWEHLLEAGVSPCGLGARDSLRLEAGLCLYGQDMDEQTSPLTSNLGWTVAWEPGERAFVGRAALEAERDSGPRERLAGLILEERGMLRRDQAVQLPDGGKGVITSGGFSPLLGRSIAMARVPVSAADRGNVTLRGRSLPVRIVRLPFVRKGKSLVG
ncbi:MAG: glycine cleavage system aminomethyltransferase GcvT [Ectothiorhodospiraceae bacterium]|nr:glycine cleavage system aminomethyltransferase GcvT [Ectothiorhodospiraceae bacterium]